jgi:hypothetical protein
MPTDKVARPAVSDEGDEVEAHLKVERPGVSDEGDEVEAHLKLDAPRPA